MMNPEKEHFSIVSRQTEETPISSLVSEVLVKKISPLRTE
jgi:hypothetical protein